MPVSTKLLCLEPVEKQDVQISHIKLHSLNKTLFEKYFLKTPITTAADFFFFFLIFQRKYNPTFHENRIGPTPVEGRKVSVPSEYQLTIFKIVVNSDRY